jgi:hypothetical protein
MITKSKLVKLMQEIAKYVKSDYVRKSMGNIFIEIGSCLVCYYELYACFSISLVKDGIDLLEDADDDQKIKAFDRVYYDLIKLYSDLVETNKKKRQENLLDFINGK